MKFRAHFKMRGNIPSYSPKSGAISIILKWPLRLLVFAVMLLGSGLTLAQQGAVSQSLEWTKIVSAARQTGKVILYTNTAQALNDRIRADFVNAVPGIALEVVRLSSSDIRVKLDLERQTGSDGADAVITAETIWLDERGKEGVLMAPSGPAARNWPKEYMLQRVAPILSLETLIVAYNSKLVRKPITSYRDLLDPQWKGKIASPTFRGAAVIAWCDWLEQTQGMDFMQKLASQELVIRSSGTDAAQSVAAGETEMTIIGNPSVLQALIKRGAPIAMFTPNPAFATYFSGAALGWSKRPNSALVLIDYLMSVRGQTVWNGAGESASPLPGIAGSLNPQSMYVMEATKYTSQALQQAGDKWDRLFRQR